MNCELCNGHLEEWGRTFHGGEVELYKCLKCGFVQQDYSKANSEYEFQKFSHRKNYHRKLEYNWKILSKFTNKEVLDLGSGPACLESYLSNTTIDVTSVDLNNQFIRLAGDRGFSIVKADITSKDLITVVGSGWELIYASHVVEHVPNPTQVLQIWVSLLRTNGVLFVEVPNFGKIYEKKRALENDHVSYFTDKTLTRLFNKLFLEVVYCETLDINYHGAGVIYIVGRKNGN